MTELSFRHVDKSIGQFLRLMQVTPLDKVIEEWKIPQHQWSTLKLLRSQLQRHGRYKKTSIAQAGTTLAQALAEGKVTQAELLRIWVPMVQDHCEKIKLLDPLNKG
jgi:hypothetical protein